MKRILFVIPMVDKLPLARRLLTPNFYQKRSVRILHSGLVVDRLRLRPFRKSMAMSSLDRVNDIKALYFQDYINAGMKYGNEKLPFFIQWNVKGDMHSTLNDRLIRVYPTLDRLNPDFPPMTFGKGDRHYLIANQPMTFKQAADLARMAGGHLAVISDDDEKELIEKYLSRTLSPNVQCFGQRINQPTTCLLPSNTIMKL
jgi:hypothetical protein